MPGLARSRDKSKKCEGYRLSFLARQMQEWLSTLGYTKPSGQPDRKVMIIMFPLMEAVRSRGEPEENQRKPQILQGSSKPGRLCHVSVSCHQNRK